MSHQRSNSTSSITNILNSGSMGIDIPSSSSGGHSRASTAPLSISIPRQRSFSSSFSLATSPRTFTGSSIISNPANPLLTPSLPSNSFSSFNPIISPTSSTPLPSSFGSSSPPSSANAHSDNTQGNAGIPILHRRFSSSFNQLNQMVSSPPQANSQAIERGRRASYFGGMGTSPPLPSPAPASLKESKGGGGLFRKFSVSGRGSKDVQHPLDRNEVGPATVGPPSNQGATNVAHIGALEHLKSPVQDKNSRSSSPMRSLILNGQMLD